MFGLSCSGQDMIYVKPVDDRRVWSLLRCPLNTRSLPVPLNLTATLQKALRELEVEKAKLDRQIAAIQAVLQASSTPAKAQPARKTAAAAKSRRRMSPQARKAVGARMKAYWAKKKAEAGKSK
jgi:hypothetical protein